MPVTLKHLKMNVKDPTTGNYESVDILSDGTTAERIAAINSAGTTQVSNVNSAGSNKVAAVNSAGDTQVANVNSAGSTQVAAVQAKGEEVLESIPEDYSSLVEDVDDLNSALTELEPKVSDLEINKADVIISSASGSIASFPDGADGLPVKRLTVGIEPVQDLHGYDSPWPAGGGKNKLYIPAQTDSAGGVTLAVNAYGIASLSGTATEGDVTFWLTNRNDINLPAGDYILSSDYAGSNSTVFVALDRQNGASVVRTSSDKEFTHESGYIYPRITVREGTNTNGIVIKPMIRLASVSDATFAPYSNLCPISGWEGVEVTRTGVNLFGGNALKNSLLTISGATEGSDNDGNYVLFQGASAINAVKLFDVFKSNAQYTIVIKYKKTNTSVASNIGILYTDGTQGYVNSSESYEDGKLYTAVITTYSGKSLQTIRAIYASGGSYIYYDQCGIFEGVLTADDFATYQGQIYPITFPSSAGTVFGATLTVEEDGTGQLVADRAIGDMGSMVWAYVTNDGEPYFYAFVTGKKAGLENMLCSVYPVWTTTGTSTLPDRYIGAGFSNNRIYLRDSRYTDTASLRTALTGQQVIYPLAEPITYTLTNLEVLELLKGQNNVWANCGDSSVTYRADTKLYIDNKLAELVAQIVNS